MTTIYTEPEKFGLRTVGEVDWNQAAYEFDLTVVWQDVDSGVLYYADDSGCSCPSPFETGGRTQLTRIGKPQALLAHLMSRKHGLDRDFPADMTTIADQIRRLTSQVVALHDAAQE